MSWSPQCRRCGSYAINHGSHGRDGSEPDLCDVCYWRKKHDDLAAASAVVSKDESEEKEKA